MDDLDCRDIVLSENYIDFLIQYDTLAPDVLEQFNKFCVELIDKTFGVIHVSASRVPPLSIEQYGYYWIPKLFGLLDTSSMDSSGITPILSQPLLDLKGQGILIGIVDTGIDYQNPIFRNADGSTRIMTIWDQTIQTGTPPSGFIYGSEYKQSDINQALTSDNPLSIVPSTDTNGHGTFLSSIAAGGVDSKNNFTGAAPESNIAVVKLKEAKQYLKNFFFIRENATAYAENDIMMGISYLESIAYQNQMPLVLLIGLGTNQGDHAGSSPLSKYLSSVGDRQKTVVVVAAGNETGRGHHYQGKIPAENDFEDVEIKVSDDETGFCLEFWAFAPELYSIAVTSPLGEFVPRIPSMIGQSQVIRFILEKTILFIDYRVVEFPTGSQLIFLRFQNPTPGIWKIRVFNNLYINGIYNMWLPMTGFLSNSTSFLRSSPDTTLTVPADSKNVLVVSTYDHKTDNIYIHSSRGYTRTDTIKPDIAAPGVEVYGAGLRNQYITKTGSSVAAAHAAGASALLMTWAIIRENAPDINTSQVITYLTRGARRQSTLTYPNREWGYGKLNLYDTFRSLQIR